MKKILLFSIALLAMTVACNKETINDIQNQETAVEEGVRTFIATSPESKTTLSDHSILWASGDKIRVIGYTDAETIGQAVYKLKSGAGTGTAVFELDEGESPLASYTTYYAVYPANKAITTSSLSSNELTFSSAMDMTAQTAVENGYDPDYAIMTAQYDEGRLVFRHGCAYIKVQVGVSDVEQVKVTFGNNAIASGPVYTASTGAMVKKGTNVRVVSATGSFVKDSYYYLPVPARAAQNPGSVTIEYKKGALTVSKTTSSLESVRLVNGEIYDLGCPPISFVPVINATDPEKIEYNTTSGDFTFTITNHDGVSSPSASVTSGGSWLSLAEPAITESAGTYTVHYTCSANAAEERNGVITVSYPGATDKPITITQKAESAAAVITVVNDDIVIGAEDTAGSIAYSLDVSGVCECTILTNDIGLVIGTITSTSVAYTCNANNATTFATNSLGTTSDRTATVKLSFSGADDKTVTITQEGVCLTNIVSAKTWDDFNHGYYSYLATQGNIVIVDNLLYNGDRLAYSSGLSISGSSTSKIDSNKNRGLVRFKVGGNGTVRIVGSNSNSSARNLYIYNGSTQNTSSVDGKSAFDKSIDVECSAGTVISLGAANSGITITSITWTPAP